MNKVTLISLLLVFLLILTACELPVTKTAEQIKEQTYEGSKEGDVEFCEKFPESTECKAKEYEQAVTE